MSTKDASYHQAAIQYNDELADFAEDLSARINHEEVARWPKSVSKQHRFHAGRHRKALEKLERSSETDSSPSALAPDEHIVRTTEGNLEVVSDTEAVPALSPTEQTPALTPFELAKAKSAANKTEDPA